MTDSVIQRLEELEAGRIFGDLSKDEWAEWESLSKDNPGVLDGSLEWTAAQLDSSLAGESSRNSLPSDLKDLVKEGTADFVVEPEASNVERPSFSAWNSAPIAWAVAAVLTLLLIVSWTIRPDTSSGLVGVDTSPDRVMSTFAGLGDYEGISGSAVWSDELQEGYMSLEGLPLNDPKKQQYQLWIVDPERDEAPVDGGVFDIVESGTVRIPIDAKLRIDDPQAFVITLEQPGGVVKSKQEVVVALAKTS